MDEYISREELRKHLKECYDDELFDADMKKAVIGIDIYVENMPSADVQPVKHGRWIPHEDEDGTHNGDNCSECGEWYVMPFRKTNFCPNCGSKNRMDGGSE